MVRLSKGLLRENAECSQYLKELRTDQDIMIAPAIITDVKTHDKKW